MDYLRYFNEIEKEFDKEIATLATIGMALHLREDMLPEDFTDSGSFGKRIHDRIIDVLWDQKEHHDTVLRLVSILYDYEIKDSLHGLGGCERKTFRQLFDESLDKERQTGVKYNNYFGAC